ncbi:Zn-dependent hydrolase [Haladaptatus sp. W1]|uniref:Zn-dependent hydrolase n=1 Tax=Haladaptatus sp. W1 TaxID=1897478 RepID=UPI0008499701|nr:Zn-dependent hydrolase [Haladaptatus sp. W1]ODR83367.1 Zn-dependent hydrolase [Haladaptatus sp. W1]
MMIHIDKERFVTAMKEQAEIGAVGDTGLHRLTLSDADCDVRDWFADQMKKEGLAIRIDEIGNMFGRRNGTNPDAKPILVGSHLDSQPNGGIYDGPLGTVAALELIRTLNEHGIETEHPIEIVNWTNEEGSRFQPAMMGSGVWAGAQSVTDAYETTDSDGNRFENELERIGYRGNEPAEPAEEYEAYLELHIEQGPVLDREDLSVGIVTGIVGFTWGAVTFEGDANHTGTTPMNYRSDALVAAADVITAVRRLPSTLGERTVGTTGVIEGTPNSINIIPGEVTITWDVRDPADEVVEEAYQRVRKEIEAAASREGVDYRHEERMRAPAVTFSDRCIEAVSQAASELGYETKRMISGAGHDATHAAAVCDTAMVFAVSKNGRSHSPAEYTSWDDAYKAANTLCNAALSLAQSEQPSRIDQ